MSTLSFNFDRKKERRKKIIIYSIISLLTIIVVFFFLNVLLSSGKVSPGVKIANIPLGGISKEKARQIIKKYTEKLSNDPITVEINGKREFIIPKDLGIQFLEEEMLKKALKFKKSLNPITHIKEAFVSEYEVPIKIAYNQENIKTFYDTLKKKYEKLPVNAKLKNKKKIVRGENGIKFKTDIKEFTEKVLNAAVFQKNREVIIETIEIKPDITFKDILKKLNLATLISSYKTSIKEKEQGSRYNVLLAAKKIDGIIIYPNEEFSYNKIVGPAEKNDGFQKGLVIVGGKFVPGYGGGVCQTSSTLYNAVLLAGLKVTERYNHSVYADATGYVPLGRDAAVYYGHKDLKFINVLPYPIVIGAYPKGDYLITEIWGREKLKAKYSIITREKEVISYKTIVKKDSNLPKGKKIIEREGINGYRIKTYLVIEEDGKTTKKFLSNDYYRPIDQIVRIGE